MHATPMSSITLLGWMSNHPSIHVCSISIMRLLMIRQTIIFHVTASQWSCSSLIENYSVACYAWDGLNIAHLGVTYGILLGGFHNSTHKFCHKFGNLWKTFGRTYMTNLCPSWNPLMMEKNIYEGWRGWYNVGEERMLQRRLDIDTAHEMDWVLWNSDDGRSMGSQECWTGIIKMVNLIYCELNDGLESQLCLWCFDLLWLYVTVCHCLVDLLSGLEYWYVWYGAWSRGLDVLLLQKKPL